MFFISQSTPSENTIKSGLSALWAWEPYPDLSGMTGIKPTKLFVYQKKKINDALNEIGFQNQNIRVYEKHKYRHIIWIYQRGMWIW